MNIRLYKIYQFVKFKKARYSTSPNTIFKFLNESQYWSRERIKRYHINKLSELVSFANKSSKYYSVKFKNIDLSQLNLNDFTKKIPSISKDEILDNYEEIKTGKYTERYKHVTSGSSGNPMPVFISERAEIFRKAGFQRFLDWWGISSHEKSVLIWRYDRSKENILKKIKTVLRSRYDINVYTLNDNSIQKHFDQIEKFQPSYIRGYKSGILEFAELLIKNELKLKRTKFKVAIVTSEILYDSERKIIENALNCKVANEYGSADAGLIAYECPFGSMHIYEEAVYLDVFKKSSVHVTELFNFSLPLINYKNDDEITISTESCGCGRTSRYIEKVKGRTSGYIIKPDGSKINQAILLSFFTDLTEIKPDVLKKYKVYQNRDVFKIKIVPLENFDSDCINYIKKRMYEEIGKDIKVEFEIVKQIEREKSGKLVYFVREEEG